MFYILYQENPGLILIKEVHKGRPIEGILDITKKGYIPDYQLVPKDKEYDLLKACEEIAKTPLKVKILPQTVDLPPLLKVSLLIICSHVYISIIYKNLKIDLVLDISYIENH